MHSNGEARPKHRKWMTSLVRIAAISSRNRRALIEVLLFPEQVFEVWIVHGINDLEWRSEEYWSLLAPTARAERSSLTP